MQIFKQQILIRKKIHFLVLIIVKDLIGKSMITFALFNDLLFDQVNTLMELRDVHYDRFYILSKLDLFISIFFIYKHNSELIHHEGSLFYIRNILV